MKALTLIGAAFVIASLAGAFIPGAAFHVYFGTEDGARAWHRKHVEPKEAP